MAKTLQTSRVHITKFEDLKDWKIPSLDVDKDDSAETDEEHTYWEIANGSRSTL